MSTLTLAGQASPAAQLRGPGQVRDLWRAVPVELRLAVAAGLVLFTGVAAGLSVSYPAPQQHALKLHFVLPIVVAAFLQALVILILQLRGRREVRLRERLTAMSLFPAILWAVFTHFNFKAWTPIVNHRTYDEALQQFDVTTAPVLEAALGARRAVAQILPIPVDNLYVILFFGMFFVSFAVSALRDAPERQRQLALALTLNLYVGAIIYWLFPAEGPFIFREGSNAAVVPAQQLMHNYFQQVSSTGELPDAYFGAALGAMPSLHVAHSLLFTLWAARSARWLLPAYVTIVLWILLEAPASGWHYLLDLPVGALLAVASFAVARRLISDSQAGTTHARTYPACGRTRTSEGGCAVHT